MSCKQNKVNLNKQSASFNIDSSCKWYDTGIDLELGKTYTFTAYKNTFWNDANIQTNACGYKPSDLKWTNPSRYALGLADLFNAKRYSSANWFEIIGCICDDKSNCPSGDCFRIFNCDNPKYDNMGNLTREFQVTKKGGRLLCYANDNSYFYFNNKGSITILVEKI